MQRFSLLLLTFVLAASAGAQSASMPGTPLFAGEERESYLRALQNAGVTRSQPWSLRAFSPAESDALTPADTARHPWAGRERVRAIGSFRLLPAVVGAQVNSAFPWGLNDGAVWAGRGLTTWASVGVSARWGPLSLVLAPMAFFAQNAAFPTMDNGLSGADRYQDGRWSGIVDYPQRFGDAAYGRLDPGESTVRLDAFGVGLGVSTAHDWWGPTQYFPTLLGTNAGGFAHMFVGTSTPVDLWLVRAHARALYGRLDQSEYFTPAGPLATYTRDRRFASGFATVLQPRGLERVEFGLARFTHAPWPDSGLTRRYFTRPLEGIFKATLPVLPDNIGYDDRSRDGENGLAAGYARLAVPEGGFELYVEFAREDHPWDRRALLLHFDEQSMLTAGFSKVWLARTGERLVRLRGERINFQQAQIDKFRGGRPIYVHSSGSNQGHTQRGQILGAGVGVSSAAGAVAALDVFQPDGRWSLEWMRTVRQDRESPSPNLGHDTRALDVVHSFGVERLKFRGRGWLKLSAGVDYDFNRDFGGDRANLRTQITLTGLP